MTRKETKTAQHHGRTYAAQVNVYDPYAKAPPSLFARFYALCTLHAERTLRPIEQDVYGASQAYRLALVLVASMLLGLTCAILAVAVFPWLGYVEPPSVLTFLTVCWLVLLPLALTFWCVMLFLLGDNAFIIGACVLGFAVYWLIAG